VTRHEGGRRVKLSRGVNDEARWWGRRFTIATALVAALVTLAACTPSAASGDGPATSDAGTRTSAGSTTGTGTSRGTVTVPTLNTGTAPTETSTDDPSSSAQASASGPAESSTPTTPTTPTTSVKPKPVATISASPAFGSTGVSVLAPFTVTVTHGTISDFTLINPTGYHVKGAISKDGRSWKLGEVLGYGKKYTATGTAVGTDGKRVPIKGSFTTVKPASTVNARINVGDGAVVGVATPIMVTFGGVNPADRALIEKNIRVTTEPRVAGAWGWINHDGGVWGLDFRTRQFWPAGTKVHVDVRIYGLDFGGGRYGASDITSDFTIGRNQVVYADVNSHNLIVKRDGKVYASYPASYGRGTDYYTTTRTGVHVINDFFKLKLMSNPRYNYRNFPAKWAVRISNNGEFIHANDGTVGDQGSTNVSHGCVNLSTTNAKKFYDSSLYGDPVIVTGTNVHLGPSDGDIFDWAIPWAEWTTLSALN
jgi:lipoprotein-anchoring transpeptidase ErfK/SrfK